MTATLIVILIIIILAILILPFSRDLMRDRTELYNNPMEKKFHIILSRINELLMDGNGRVVTFKNDPRSLNLFDKSRPNMIINFYYSTGTLNIILRYKFFQVELVKQLQFHDMRQADAFSQQDVANHFCEEAQKAIVQHQNKVSATMGHKNASGNYAFYNNSTTTNLSNPINLLRGMYDTLPNEVKLAIVYIGLEIFRIDGDDIESFQHHPAVPTMLLSLQVNFSDAINRFGLDGKYEAIKTLKDFKSNNNVATIVLIMPLLPLLSDANKPSETKVELFLNIFSQAGFSRNEIYNEVEKVMLLSKI